MNIIIGVDGNARVLSEYFDFNHIPYSAMQFRIPDNPDNNYYQFPNELIDTEHTLLIIDNLTLANFCSFSRNQFVKFCNKNNHVWSWQDIDGFITLSFLIQANVNNILPQAITLFIDGEPSTTHPINQAHNLQYNVLPFNFFSHQPRIEDSVVNKVNCSRDFMLTMIKKPSAPHREILWKKLNAVPGLINQGHTNYNPTGSVRIGEQSHQHEWSDGHPSMDLYLDSWLEIVPETLYKGGYYITEKTIKPIATKTPFLSVSTCYYLKYLKQFGFKTFDGIISERYDQEFRIEDRVNLLVEQLQDIIANGTESFYHTCAPILEHNQNRLLEITGRRQYDMDLFIRKNLDAIGFK